MATTKQINFSRPLVSIWTVLSLTDFKTEDDVLKAIDDGRLLYAFNFASKNAKSRLVRVLASSVRDFVEGRQPPTISAEQEWESVMRLIFPTPVPEIPAKEIARAFNISTTLLLNLCDQKLLRLAKGTPRHTGLGGSPLVEYRSAVEFLKTRRIF